MGSEMQSSCWDCRSPELPSQWMLSSCDSQRCQVFKYPSFRWVWTTGTSRIWTFILFQCTILMVYYIFLWQLSDFGLAIWGPSDSSFLTDNDVVGTFGYLAPEYFMYGKVSDKIDVYSFGVVLLELLSGRKPISSESTKGQESLVMWVRPFSLTETSISCKLYLLEMTK